MTGQLSWTNPTLNTDGTAYATTDQAGIDIVIDGQAAVSVPVGAATSFDMTTLAAWPALAVGTHTVAIDVVTKEGVHSALTAPVTFQLTRTPMVPTALAVH